MFIHMYGHMNFKIVLFLTLGDIFSGHSLSPKDSLVQKENTRGFFPPFLYEKTLFGILFSICFFFPGTKGLPSNLHHIYIFQYIKATNRFLIFNFLSYSQFQKVSTLGSIAISPP